MFGVPTPLSKPLSGDDFDSVNAIFGSSSFQGKADPPWLPEVDQDGTLFYLDAGKVDNVFPTNIPHLCCESSAGWCSTRTCKCSNSEDTGYSTDNDLPSPKSEKVSKKSNKFTSFLKWKGSKTSSSQKQDFITEDSFSLEMETVKEVTLLVDPTVHSSGKYIESLCEQMLGIIPGILRSSDFQDSKQQKVIVKGLVPDGTAIKMRDIRIGDWLKSVDGQDVNWSTIDSVLKSITSTRKVKLKLESVGDQCPSPLLPPVDHQYESLVELDAELARLQLQGGHNSTGVFYVSMEGITSDNIVDQDDLVYSYPPGENVLTSLRGVFYTLSHLLKETVVSNIKNSSFVVDEETLVHAAYHIEGKELLLLVIPDKWCSLSVLNSVMSDVVRLFRLLTGSVEDAFRHNQNRHMVDQIFSLLLKSISGETRIGPVNQIHSHPSLVRAAVNQNLSLPSLVGTFTHCGHVQYLPVSSDVLLHLSTTLSDFESSDFVDMSDSFYGCRRSYNILGSCLFYKGYLLCSHLCRDDLIDIHVYLSYHSLLALTANQKISQLIIWREIFPLRFCYDVSDINNTFGYSEPHARWFLLVIGLKHGLLAVILEAGGCAAQVEGKPRPDPFYIDQARCALVQLQTTELIAHFDTRLAGNGLPQTVSIDNFLSRTVTDMTHSGVFLEEQGWKNPGSVLPVRHKRRKGSIESDGSGESGSSDGLFRTHRHHRMFPAELGMGADYRTLTTDLHNPRFGKGVENCVFHFCSLNTMEGLYISSPMSETDSPVHSELLISFYKCCTLIHDVFQAANTRRSLLNQEDEPVFMPDRSLMSVKEHGVLFNCQQRTGPDSKKLRPSLAYWVVGRKYTRPVKQELFVCFHESTPQNVIEMAFQLGFGLLSPG